MKTTYKLHIHQRTFLGDTLTPVSIYLSLRDEYPGSILLESSDYHGNEHTYSYICAQQIAGFQVNNGILKAQLPDSATYSCPVSHQNLVQEVDAFLAQFKVEQIEQLPFIHKGLFGYMTYDSVQMYEDINFKSKEEEIPMLNYGLFKYIIAYNHSNHQLHIITTTIGDEVLNENEQEKLISLIKKPAQPVYHFNREGEKQSNLSDEEFISIVKQGISHCHRGDVFQIVLSRLFKQSFSGDDFNVYRALRSINPSPYLFYFDMGGFRIFGSSPEAQIVIKGNSVTIHPIAGTFRRTGDDAKDAALAQQLTEDPKENAEHIMLVDLARNDLSRCGKKVQVEVYREVQFYSHVIHLVSKVTAELSASASRYRMVGDTFPAGTLSGAPKYSAMQIIDGLENTPRSFYGGALGHMDFDGNFNHAIMIRTFLSKDNQLTFRAGAGVVADSKPESELQEVENKLMALNKAIIMAEQL